MKYLLYILLFLPCIALSQPANRMPAYDLTKDRLLYTVGYSHLDTQWNWDYVRSIDEYLKNVITENIPLFEEYPDYVFNFTGSRRYRMMKEYYPDLYEKVKEYVAKGRWFIAGSAVDEGEVIISSPESIIRQTLYGTKYFMREFGTTGQDALFPDIFGFPASMPTIWRHSGLIGFSTIKIAAANSAIGVPFSVGVWKGPDGSGLMTALRPGHYVSGIPERFDRDENWSRRLDENRRTFGYAFDFRMYGVGDQGGAPYKNDVKHAVGSLPVRNDSKFRVLLTSSDQIFKDITPEIEAKLPTYEGDMFLVEHSNGSSVSQGFMKRMNRKNENLAQAAEQAAAAASFLTGKSYPTEKLTEAWELVLGSQMHDILPGTSLPKAYEYSWNDEFIAANLFASTLKNGLAALSATLDTRTKGRSVIIYNPVSYRREDIVTAEMSFDPVPDNISVYNSEGKEVMSQVIGRKNNMLKFIFLADVPSLGLAVYDVRKVEGKVKKDALQVTQRTLENDYYKVMLADNGNIQSIYDKKLKKELLSAPARLEFLIEKPVEYPAWNMDWKDRQLPPVGYLDENAVITIVENGPLRVALEVNREGRNSKIKQIISLSAGESGKRLEIDNRIDWQSRGVSLKASFPLSAANEYATYSMDVGTTMRNNNHAKKFEVPHHKWFDLTDKSGKFGVSIMEDCKYTSDKPDDNTLRLTLMFTPEHTRNFQSTQDFGIHCMKYALYSHAGDWREAETYRQASFFDKPLVAFETAGHEGFRGKNLSLLTLSNRKIGVMAFKKAEEGDFYIIRVNELTGKKQTNAGMKFPLQIKEAWEVNGREEKIADAIFDKEGLRFDIPGYAIKSFAVRLVPVPVNKESQSTVNLAYNEDVVSFDNNRMDGRMDNRCTYPAEEMPENEFVYEGTLFKMGSINDQSNNAIACAGQKITIPQGQYDKLFILAAAKDDVIATFSIGGKNINCNIGAWTGYRGQHYNRIYSPRSVLESVSEPYVKKDEIAWFASHYHTGYPSKNETYQFCYIYRYEIDVPAGAETITLPDNKDIKVFAMTAVNQKSDHVIMLQDLYDNFADHPVFEIRK